MLNQLTIGTQNSDRTLVITDASWEEYENLELPHHLVSFRNRVITIEH